MGDWLILSPEGTINYVGNPSFESSSTGWTAVGSVITRTRERARFDSWALEVNTAGSAIGEGVYVRTALVSGKGGVYTASIYVRGQGKLRIRIYDGLTGDVSISKPFVVDDLRWKRVSITGMSSGSNDLRLYVETAESVQAVTFYLDGAQMEPVSYTTTYCDGRQEECRWNGVSDASTSSRYDNCYSGGKWTKLSDPEANIYATLIGGSGMAPTEVNFQRTAQYPGATFDNLRINERSFTMTLTAVDFDGPKRGPRDLTGLHNLRSSLLDLIKPDRNPNNNPLVLGYLNDDVLLTMQVRYDGGLEFSGDIRNKYVNTIPLRFLALDPFWYEDSQEAALLDTEEIVDYGSNGYGFAAARVNGFWTKVGIGIDNPVYAIGSDITGRLYFGGDFVEDINTTQVRKFGKFNDDFSLIQQIRSGLNGIVRVIRKHPNGNVYAGGDFTTDNAGNPMRGLVQYNPTANTFTNLITSMGGTTTVYDIQFDERGHIYIGGAFDDINSVPNTKYLARYDLAGTWHSVGTNSFDSSIHALVVQSSTSIYAAGVFGSPASRVAFFDGLNWDMLSAAVIDGAIYQMKEAPDGSLVIRGAFTDIGGETINRVARWNGSAFVPLGTGISTNTVTQITPDALLIQKDGTVIVGGDFTSAGGNTNIRALALWNGFSWVQPDIRVSAGNAIISLFEAENGDIYIGYAGITGIRRFEAAGRTIVGCVSTVFTHPLVRIFGKGTILWLENQTTGERVYMNYSSQSEEIVTLDFNTQEFISNYAGNVPTAILAGSDNLSLLGTVDTQSRDNIISFLMIDETSPVAQLLYTPRHWSFDAVVVP